MVTSNITYYNFTELAGRFIRSHLFNGTVILDTVDISSCEVVPKTGTLLLSYNTGLFLEGVSVHSRNNPQPWLPLCVFLLLCVLASQNKHCTPQVVFIDLNKYSLRRLDIVQWDRHRARSFIP